MEEFLDRVDEPMRPAAFRELLNIEVELRRARHEQVTVADYLARFPAHEPAIRKALDQRTVALATVAREVELENGKGRVVDGAETRPHDSDSSSNRLQVRCPSCHTPMEVAVDTVLTDLTCTACGSHFSLIDQSQATRIAPPLSTMGRFELIERIGIGAFGSVWKARDKSLDRTVAIKIPRQGAMTPEEQEKFFREARAAAQLRHPNIVSVHEVGREGDTIFIVSDFVRGVTLGDWLSGQQPTTREAAGLCAKIADALHHAHEQGIIHRDLKPANIMIDDDGGPHLMDFGLARREVGEVTIAVDGFALGTPAYMSPEQAEGKAHTADRRSDVYSLGVILYEMLTGERPFRGNHRMLIRQAIYEEPRSTRRLNDRIPRDLDTICMKCLQKAAAARYASAAELAADLRRWQSGQPIHARPVPKWERAAKWVRRHPAPSGLAVVLCLATLGGIAGLTWHNRELEERNIQLERSRGETADALKEAKAAATAAQEQGKRAEREAENAKQVLNVLVGAFESANPIYFGGYRFGNPTASQSHLSARDILERSYQYVRNREQNLDPMLRSELLDSIGNAYAGMGALKNASDCLEEALRIRKALYGSAANAELATTLHNLGFLGFEFGRYEEAEQRLREALAMRTALYGAADPYHAEIAMTKFILAATSLELEFQPEIESLLRDVVTAGEHGLKGHDRELAFANAGLGIVLARQGKTLAGLKYLNDAQTILGQAGDEVATVFQKVAWSVVQSQSGNNTAAANTLLAALADAERIVGEIHPAVHIMRLDLAKSFHRLGDFDKAFEILTSTVELANKGLGRQPRTAEAVYLLGDVLLDQGEIEAANEQYEEAFEILKECGYAERQEGAEISYRMGMLALVRGENGRAVEAFNKTLAIMAPRSRQRLAAYGHIGLGLATTASSITSSSELEAGIGILLGFGGDGPRVIAELASLGDTFLSNELRPQAQVLYGHALRIDEEFRLSDGFPVGRACYGLARCLKHNDREEEARPYLERAVKIFEAQLGAEDHRTIEAKALLTSP
jgi:tetratricopeptide (TPR) repeat protein